jgi:hypothetical protein
MCVCVGNAALKFVGEVTGRISETQFDKNPACIELVQPTMPLFVKNLLLNNALIVRCHEAIVGAPLLDSLADAIKANRFMPGLQAAVVLHGHSKDAASVALVRVCVRRDSILFFFVDCSVSFRERNWLQTMVGPMITLRLFDSKQH